jgi:hypothetical protein
MFDPENSYEDDNVDYNYDDHDDFFRDDLDELRGREVEYDDHGSIEDWPGECEDSPDSDPDGDGDYDPDYDVWDSMDGDHDSAMTSCGWGTDEDYGYYGDDDREDFHSDDGYGSYDD